MTRDEQLDYLAGFFDADGSIHSRSTGKRQGISFAVTQATPTVPQMFKENFGGNVAPVDRHNPKWRTTWLWSRGCTKVSSFIGDMSGRVVIRSQQLAIAAKFLESLRSGNHRRYKELDPITIAHRETLLRTLSDLNHGRCSGESIFVATKSDAYWAGFFDGDGSIGVQKSANCRGLRLDAQLFSVYEPILMAAQVQFGGGNIYHNVNGKRCHKWMACHVPAERFLRCVRPFLIEKKERVEIALKIADVIRDSPKDLIRKKRHAVWMFTDSTIEKMSSLAMEMKVLNRRGPMRGMAFEEAG